MIRSIIRKFGFDVVIYPARKTKENPKDGLVQNRIKLLHTHAIDLVLDVGANTGGFARELRRSGYKGQIESFEPLTDAFLKLTAKSSNDPHWNVHNWALGESECESFINVAGNSVSSSILEMMPLHEKSAPESRYVTKEKIVIKPLSQLMPAYLNQYKKIYLKLDVQGFEHAVLKGLGQYINQIEGIQTEMSLEMLYAGELTFFEFSKNLLEMGFNLKSLEPGFANETTGQLLQVDGIWYH